LENLTMHRSLFPLASLFTLIVVAPGCADRSSTGPEQLDPRVLYGFESCDELLGYAKGNAKDIIEEYGNPWGYDEGLDGGGEPVGSTGDPSGGEGGDSGGDAPSDGENGGDEGGGGKDYSGTNVQEVGVDEPDLVKTDGERILALAQGKLHFVDASGASPQKRGSLELGDGGWDAQMFMHEDRALLLMRSYIYNYEDYGGEGEPSRTVSSRSRPRASTCRSTSRPTPARSPAWSRSTSATRITCASSATCTSTATW
jgi:hypothetical protein